MIVLRELASAKVNLYLHVLGKRPDGYHLLDSLVGFADIGDRLEVVPSQHITLMLEGPGAGKLSAHDNSVVKAAEMLRKYAGITAGAAITLHKRLPVAAGIGGGSADAAAALRLLLRFWNLELPRDTLMAMALDLGADVPACLRSSSLYMSGIGESIETGPSLDGMYIVLVNPGIPLKTPDVFARRSGSFSTPPRHPQAFSSVEACAEFLQRARNDLQPAALSLMPEIGAVLEAIAQQKGCLLARMSGSGATCFGLFADSGDAKQAALSLSTAHSTWWADSGALR